MLGVLGKLFTDAGSRFVLNLLGPRAIQSTGALRLLLYVYLAQMLLGLAIGFSVPFLQLWGVM
jgi:hypothetical protein